jgi:hypothetical protein
LFGLFGVIRLFTLALFFANLISILDLNSDAKTERNASQDRQCKGCVGFSGPKKISGETDEPNRRDLKYSVHWFSTSFPQHIEKSLTRANRAEYVEVPDDMTSDPGTIDYNAADRNSHQKPVSYRRILSYWAVIKYLY